jgi:hypothetical protein
VRGTSRAILNADHFNVRSLYMKPVIRSLIAGLAWGVIGAVMYWWAPFYVVVGILVSGPLIGFAIFSLSRWSYRSRLATA